MKKTFLAAALAVAVSGAAHAQKSNISLGLKAGATYSSLEGALANNYESIFGFHAGAFANIGITDFFAFQPEIIYSQKGARVTNFEINTRLSYIDVPLAFHVNTNGLFFEAGPQIGLLVGAADKKDNVTFDRKNLYNTFDFGYLAGLGYQRKDGLGIGLRYNGGFTKVEKPLVVGPLTIQNNFRNSTFQLYLTYSINER